MQKESQRCSSWPRNFGDVSDKRMSSNRRQLLNADVDVCQGSHLRMEATLKEKSKEKEKLESLPLGEDRGRFS